MVELDEGEPSRLMGIDKPSGGADSSPDRPERPDRPREPEYRVPLPEYPAARDRPRTPPDRDAPVTRQERAAAAEAARLARIARRAEKASAEATPEARPEGRRDARPEARPGTQREARPGAQAEARPGDKGVITHFRGPTVDLYTDGTRWASGDVIRAREAERQRRDGMTERREPTTGRREGVTEVPAMREQGRSVIGDKPNDGDDLPPDRRELMETPDKRSRIDRLRRNAEDPDTLGDLHDQSADQTNLWQKNLDHRQPQGHPVQVHNDSPHVIGSHASQPTAGDFVGAGIAAGLLAIEGWRALRRLMNHKKEVD